MLVAGWSQISALTLFLDLSSSRPSGPSSANLCRDPLISHTNDCSLLQIVSGLQLFLLLIPMCLVVP